jgi:hypothetical protein
MPYDRAARPGEEIRITARATSHPRDVGSGALARRVEYDIRIVDGSGRTVERVGVELDIPLPADVARGVPIEPRVIPGGLGWLR